MTPFWIGFSIGYALALLFCTLIAGALFWKYNRDDQ